jgi:cytochrome c oxidase subunit 2
MSVTSPERIWWKPLSRQERLWVGVSLAWCIVLFISMPLWHLVAPVNTPRESYRITAEQYRAMADRFITTYKVGEEKGVPIVAPPAGSDAYLVAKAWQWTPILQFKKGQTYRLHLASLDFNHGFSLQPMNMNFQVVPGLDYVLTITPNQAGEFSLLCNEYCGVGHHLMSGKIIVKE